MVYLTNKYLGVELSVIFCILEDAVYMHDTYTVTNLL